MTATAATTIAAPSIDDILTFAQQMADTVRPLALRYFRTPLDIASKADDSPVTVAIAPSRRPCGP